MRFVYCLLEFRCKFTNFYSDTLQIVRFLCPSTSNMVFLARYCMEQVANGHLLGELAALQPHQSHFFLLNHHSESAVQTTHATMGGKYAGILARKDLTELIAPFNLP